MPHSIFIETTIPSYYVSRPSRNLLQFARQELTREWWDNQRQDFELFTSQLVLDEAAEGEPAKASERLGLLAGLPLLDLNEQVKPSPPNWLRAVFCLPWPDATPFIWRRQAFTAWIFC